MFLDFYHMREQPFGVTPDPRFLYLSPTHREALASATLGDLTESWSKKFARLIPELRTQTVLKPGSGSCSPVEPAHRQGLILWIWQRLNR